MSPLSIFRPNDKVLYHLISFSTIREGKTGQHKDLVFDPTKDKWGDFLVELQKRNETGFNVYSSINLYTGNARKKKDLLGYRGFMIDIDSKDDNFHYSEILKKINSLKKNLGISPLEINETFKGYHILYGIHYQSQNITDKAYEEMYKFLVSYFWGDDRAMKVTSLFKMHGFIDHKKDEFWESRNYKIRNVYSLCRPEELYSDYEDCLITYKTINSLLFMLEDPTDLLLKTVKKTKQRTKVISAEHRAIHDHIDEIDALVLIDVLNKKYQNREYWFNKEVVVKSYAVDDTSGLRVYLQPNGIHTFKDFANKGRYGIYGFLYHYYFKIPENEEGINAEFIYKFLNEEFGVKKALTRRNYSYIGLNTLGNYVFDEFCYTNSETIKWEDFQILLKIKEALKEASVYTLENERNTILIDKRGLLESLTKNELSRAISIFPLIGRRQKTETSFEDISVKARKEIEILQNLLSSIDVNSTTPLVLTDEKKNMLLEKSQSIAKYLNRNNVQQASYGGLLDISERDGYLLINIEKDTKYFEKNPKQKKFLPKKFLNFLTSTRSGKAFKALITLYWGLQSYGKYKVHFSEFGYKSKSSVYALIKRSGLVDSGFITIKLEKDYFYIGNKYNNILSRTNKERASK